jgi:hypothetical protein
MVLEGPGRVSGTEPEGRGTDPGREGGKNKLVERGEICLHVKQICQSERARRTKGRSANGISESN